MLGVVNTHVFWHCTKRARLVVYFACILYDWFDFLSSNLDGAGPGTHALHWRLSETPLQRALLVLADPTNIMVFY